MKIAAIIPAYNEEKHIEEVISNVKKYVDDVIVVDDGSQDKTSEKAKKANLVLRHIVNLGKGVALKTGMIAALKKKADIIITIDADGQHSPGDIPGLIKALDGNDVVLGVRKESEKVPFVKKIGNRGLNFLFRILFGLKVSDTQSGFRVFTLGACRKLTWNSQGYAVETEILTKIKKHNLKFVEVPISTVYLDNYKGTSIFDGLRIGLKMILWKLKE